MSGPIQLKSINGLSLDSQNNIKGRLEDSWNQVNSKVMTNVDSGRKWCRIALFTGLIATASTLAIVIIPATPVAASALFLMPFIKWLSVAMTALTLFALAKINSRVKINLVIPDNYVEKTEKVTVKEEVTVKDPHIEKNLQVALQNNEGLTQENVDLKNELEALKANHDQLNKEKSKVEEEKNQLQNNISQYNDSQDEIAQLQQEKAQLQKELQEERQKNTNSVPRPFPSFSKSKLPYGNSFSFGRSSYLGNLFSNGKLNMSPGIASVLSPESSETPETEEPKEQNTSPSVVELEPAGTTTVTTTGTMHTVD